MSASGAGKSMVLVGLVLVGSWLALVLYMWSPRPYWPDADGYLLHVAEGRWVAHPPGYALFVILGRFFHAVGCPPYVSVQMASLSLTVAGLVVLHRLLHRFLEPLRAMALTAAAAFSWAVLLNVQTGTSHAADLFTVSLILLAATRLPGAVVNSAWSRDLLFGLSLFLCAGFRPAALIMLLPLCLLVAWNNRHRISFWVACFAAAFVIVAWQSWVIWQSGGYAIYSATVAGMNEANARSSLIASGLTETSVLNILRALLWVFLATLPFLAVVLLRQRQAKVVSIQPALSYGLAAWLLPWAGVALYLCTHPGFAVAPVPGAALTAAALLAGAEGWFPRKTFAVAVFLSVVLIVTLSPIVPPTRKWQAVANGLLLQYSANCSRQAVFNTTARWLRLGGLEAELPAHRVRELQIEDEWREHFKTIDPAAAKP
jgi:hypothetical protein